MGKTGNARICKKREKREFLEKPIYIVISTEMRNGSINSRNEMQREKPHSIQISTEMENASDRHLPGIVQKDAWDV